MTICTSKLQQSRIQFLENLYQKSSNMFSSEDDDNHVQLRATALVAHCAWDTTGLFSYMKTDQQILFWNEHS